MQGGNVCCPLLYTFLKYSIKHALAIFFCRGKCLLFAPLRGMTLDAFCAAAEKDFVISREERYDIKV